MNDFRGVSSSRYAGKILGTIAGWLALVAAAVLIALALTGCATPLPPTIYPTYACFQAQTDRGPAMVCTPVTKEKTP